MLVMEQIIDHVASILGMPSAAVRELNMYHDGDKTPWGQVQSECPVRRCWGKLLPVFEEKRTVAEQFNK